jgi:hypothetical protein
MRIEQLWPLLEASRKREASRSSRKFTSGWVLRRAQPLPNCHLLVGIDLSAGQRGLLLEVPQQAVPHRKLWARSRGLDWLVVPQRNGTALFGVCLKDLRHSDLFDALANDLARRVIAASAGPSTEIAALLGGVARWQKFLATGIEGLSDEAQRGLWGELYFLRTSILPTHGSAAGVASWQGSQKAHQDFLFSRGAVEIKTTVAKAPHVVRITSERQFDDANLPALYLRHFALAVREGAGETLPEMVASLRKKLQAEPAVAEQFEDALLAAGYVDAHAWRYEERGYSVRETNDFEVRRGFPRIVERNLPSGIGDVRYALSLDACHDFLMGKGALLSALTPLSQVRTRRL